MVTEDLRSYGSAARELGLESRRERGRWKNNRAENSHHPTRQRAQDAALQERRLRAEVSFEPCCRLQHIQHPTPSHLSPNASRASGRGDEHVAQSSCGELKSREAENFRVLYLAT